MADVLSNDKVMKVQKVQRNFKMLIADVLSNYKVMKVQRNFKMLIADVLSNDKVLPK